MRAYVWMAAAVAVMAGCLDGDKTDDETPTSTAGPQPTQELPENITTTGMFVASADPLNIGGFAVCSTPTAECHQVPFAVTDAQSGADLTATLSWSLPANDLDLYLYFEGEQISMDGINNVGDAPNNQQVMNHPDLAAGDYYFLVVGWNAVGESYALDVTFA